MTRFTTWLQGRLKLLGRRKLPLVIGALLVSSAVGTSSCSRILDNRVRHAQVLESDAKGSLAGQELIDKRSLETQRAEDIQRLDILQRLEWTSYDWRAKRAARTEGTPQVGLVFAGDGTVDRIGSGDAFPVTGERYDLFWPRWPVYGRVLRELRAQGAKSIALDVLLMDRRLSEDGIQLVEKVDGVLSTNLILSDVKFAAHLAEGPPAILAALPGATPVGLFNAAASALGDASSPKDADSVARRVRAVSRMKWLNPEIGIFAQKKGWVCDASEPGQIVFEGAGADGADIVLTPDEEGNLVLPVNPRFGRKVPMYVEKPVWHLGIAAAGRALGLDLDRPESVPGGLRLRGTNGVERVIPVDEAGFLQVDWKLSWNGTALDLKEDFASLIEADQAREFAGTAAEPRWTNRVVVMGSIASGNNLTDRGATPLDKADFLVTMHLNVADMVLQNRYVRRLGAVGEAIVVGLMSLFAAVMTWKTRGFVLPLVIGGAAVVWGVVAFWAYGDHLYWLPVAHPVFAGLLIPYIGMVTTRAFFEHREQQRVRGVFAKMVSPDIVDEVLQAQQLESVGSGKRRRVTVFFADVRGFTELTDRVQAAAELHVREAGLDEASAERYYEERAGEVLATVNLYLATIADVVKFHRGTLDKYIGDCVMAFWGAPTNNPRHALNAVMAALDAQWAIQKLNEARQAESARREAANVERVARGEAPLPPLPVLNLGSGLNTGDVTVGLMGSDAHIVNYTVFGREVNLASRLEGASGRARILVGSATYDDLRKHAPELAALCTALEPIAVKGFRDQVRVYEVPWREARETAAKSGALFTLSITSAAIGGSATGEAGG